MKRYMKLIRTVLEYVECHGDSEFLSPPEVSGGPFVYSERITLYPFSPSLFRDLYTWHH